MFFSVFGDIFAVYIFPGLLALINLPIVMVFILLCGTSLNALTHGSGDTGIILLAVPLLVGELTYELGRCTPHQRTIPADLKNYMSQCFKIMLVSDVVAIVAYPVLTVVSLLPVLSNFIGVFGSVMAAMLAVFLGGLVFSSLASRTLLQAPLPETDPKLIRGHDLEDQDTIEERAWDDI